LVSQPVRFQSFEFRENRTAREGPPHNKKTFSQVILSPKISGSQTFFSTHPTHWWKNAPVILCSQSVPLTGLYNTVVTKKDVSAANRLEMMGVIWAMTPCSLF
jgi:hypothetical protein